MDIDVFPHLRGHRKYRLKSLEILKGVLSETDDLYLLGFLARNEIKTTEAGMRAVAKQINKGMEYVMLDGWMFPSECFTPD